MKTIRAEYGKRLCIGREGENNARQVIFDLSDWRAVYGPGTVQLLVQRTGEATPYPAALTVDGSRAIWTISAADTAIPGQFGKAELRYLVGDTLAKSETWPTTVSDALGEPSETPPEAYRGWVDQVLQAGADVQINAAAAGMARQGAENAKGAAEQYAADADASAKVSQEGAHRAEKAAVRQPYPNPDTGTWWTWDMTAGAYKDTGETCSGNVMYATFDLDPRTSELHMITPDGYAGPKFTINENGELEVSIHG